MMNNIAPVPQTAPYSQEAEEAVIGCILIDSSWFPFVSANLKADHFYILRHAYIWEAMTNLAEREEVIDVLTLKEELRKMNRLSDIGGAGYITQLSINVPTSIHAETYGQLVVRAAARRFTLQVAEKMHALAFDEQMPLEDVLTAAEKALLSIRERAFKKPQDSLYDRVLRVSEVVENRMSGAQVVGVSSGLTALDELTGGFGAGELIILAGRPGMGKSAALFSIALNAALQGKRVGIATQEMNGDQVVERLISMQSRVNLQRMRMGRMGQNEWGSFLRATGEISKLDPLIAIDDANGLTPAQLRADAMRWMNNANGLDLLIVDYLQILSSGGLFKPNERVAEVGYFARTMKQLARELQIPILCAAQINRGVDDRADKRPRLSDLRESGEIEQEADQVIFLYREAAYDEAADPHALEAIVAKNRNGAVGTAHLHFEGAYTRVSNAQVIDLSVYGHTGRSGS